jgi:hypothetical protein
MLLLQNIRFIVIISGSYQLKAFFPYQTKICVAAGEPHPQPRYQMAPKLLLTTLRFKRN